MQLENHSAPINRKDIATAIHKRNILRQTESIQISPNGQFCSIKFQTQQVMQTFCTEGLTISEGNNIYFKPDYKPRQHRSYTFISFLNVPLETEEKELKAYVQEYCTVHGVHNPHQKINDITYKTSTRVSNITDHLPRSKHIFGRLVRIIYDGQLDRRRQSTDEIENDQQHLDTHNNSDNDNPTTIQETPISQMPDIDNPTTIQETPISQKPEPSHHQSATIDQPDAPRLPTDDEKDSRTVVPHPTMDLTIEEFPTLPTLTPVPNLDIQEIPDINKFLDDSMEPYTTQHKQHNPNNLQKTTRPNFR